VADLFRLYRHKEHLMDLEGWGKVKTEKLLKSIEHAKKTKPFVNVLFGLGIPHVGYETAQVLVEHFKCMESLRQATKEEFISIHSIGEVIAEAIFEFFHSRNLSNLNSVKKLEDCGVALSVDDIRADTDVPLSVSSKFDEKFKGKTVVISGTYVNYGRDQLKDALRAVGAKVAHGVSKATDFLIIGMDAGPQKMDKASELGVEVIGELELKELVEGVSSASPS